MAMEGWLNSRRGTQARDLADKALASFVVIQAALKRSRRLWAYCQREDLNQRMPNFAVSLPKASVAAVHLYMYTHHHTAVCKSSAAARASTSPIGLPSTLICDAC